MFCVEIVLFTLFNDHGEKIEKKEKNTHKYYFVFKNSIIKDFFLWQTNIYSIYYFKRYVPSLWKQVCHNIKESKQNLLAKIEIKKIYHITLLINSVSGYSRDPQVNGAPHTPLIKKMRKFEEHVISESTQIWLKKVLISTTNYWCLMSLPTILLYVRLVLLIDETGVPRENNRDMSKVTKKN